MMIYLPGLVVFLLALTAEARVGDSSSVPFCSETEQCLLFNLTCTSDCYEVRHYDSAKLVSNTETSWTMWMALMRSFRRLYAYISGDNEEGIRIQMTSPVIVKMEQTNAFNKKYTMSFVLPAEHQANPTAPADDDVVIEELKDVTVYVRTFGGWMNGWSIKRNVESLTACLKAAGATFDDKSYYFAGYNSPMTTKNRHNEVWIVAAGEPKCPSKN